MIKPDEITRMTPEEWSIGAASLQRYNTIYDEYRNAYKRDGAMQGIREGEEGLVYRVMQRLASEASAQNSGLDTELFQNYRATISLAYRANAAFDAFVSDDFGTKDSHVSVRRYPISVGAGKHSYTLESDGSVSYTNRRPGYIDPSERTALAADKAERVAALIMSLHDIESQRDRERFETFSRRSNEKIAKETLGRAGIFPQAIAAKQRAKDTLANTLIAQQGGYKETEGNNHVE